MKHVPPPVPVEELGDYELRVRRYGLQNLVPFLRSARGKWAVAALVAFAILAWNARGIYRVTKIWRVEKLVAQCEAAERAGDEATAARLLHEAYKLLTAHPLTWRARAHYFETREVGAALVAYLQLLGSARATVDDAVRGSRLAGLRGSPDTRKQFVELVQRIAGAGDQPAVLALRARALAAAGSWDDAVALAQKASDLSHGEAPEGLLLAITLLEAADRGDGVERLPSAERAVALLADLALGADATAVDALTALVSLARNPAAPQLFAARDIDAWVAAVERHPKASARLRVSAWNLRLVGQREDAEKVFAAFLDKWRESPLPERLEAARWLNQKGRARLGLELSGPQKEVSGDWFLVHLDALAAIGDWAAVLAQVDGQSGQAKTMSGALRTLFRLRARAEMREPFDADEAWRDIQIQVRSEPSGTRVIFAQYAEKVGEVKRAESIYQHLLADLSAVASLDSRLGRESKLACYQGLLRTQPLTTPAAEMARIARAFAAEFPEIKDARNEAMYLRLLAGEVDEAMRAGIPGLLQSAPTLADRTTAALFELCLGNPEAALKIYDGVEIDWSSAPDGFKAVGNAVFAAAGRPEEARKLRTLIRETKLRPEELALLR